MVFNTSSNLHIITDSLKFCHYDTILGYFIGLIQYIPMGLFIGTFFWSLIDRDDFFINLTLILKLNWIFGLLFKYVIFPYPLYNPITNIIGCDNFIPSFFNPFFNIITNIKEIVFGNTTISTIYLQELSNADVFPHIDILQSGTYLGYILIYYIISKYPIRKIFLFAIMLLALIPLSFASTASVTPINILISYYVGLGTGIGGYFVGYYIYLRGGFLYLIKRHCFSTYCCWEIKNNKKSLHILKSKYFDYLNQNLDIP